MFKAFESILTTGGILALVPGEHESISRFPRAGRRHLATALLWKEMTRADLVMAIHDVALALGA